jgi:hypothetical protein
MHQDQRNSLAKAKEIAENSYLELRGKRNGEIKSEKNFAAAHIALIVVRTLALYPSIGWIISECRLES